MEFAAKRLTATATAVRATTSQRCTQCRMEALVLNRRHVSPPHFGDALVTEYYACDCCDAEFQFSPLSVRWKPVYN